MITDLDAWTFLTYRLAALLKILSHILFIKNIDCMGGKNVEYFWQHSSFVCNRLLSMSIANQYDCVTLEFQLWLAGYCDVILL